MTTQTPRRPEDYLVSMQAPPRVSSPVSHVLQGREEDSATDGRAGIQEVLRQQYTLPPGGGSSGGGGADHHTTHGSQPSSDRDQGYATSSNSEVYAPGMFEVHAGEDVIREVDEGEATDDEGSEAQYALNVDGLVEALPNLQEAKCRNRLSQFSMPDLSPNSHDPTANDLISPVSEGRSDLITSGSDPGADLGADPGSQSGGSDRNMSSVHYASVSIPHHQNHHYPPDEDPNTLMSPAAIMMMNHGGGPHLQHQHQPYYQQPGTYVDHHHYSVLPPTLPAPSPPTPILHNNGYPLYRQVAPQALTSTSARSHPDLGSGVRTTCAARPPAPPHSHSRTNANALPLPDSTKMNPISRPPSSQAGTPRPVAGCSRSQSFEGHPGNLGMHANHHSHQHNHHNHHNHHHHSSRHQHKQLKQHSTTSLGPPTTASRDSSSASGMTRQMSAPNTSTRARTSPRVPPVLDSAAADRFMYGNFNEDNCSTCSSSSSGDDDWDYARHFAPHFQRSPHSANKISYVDDIGASMGASHSRGPRRHRQKSKQCVLQ